MRCPGCQHENPRGMRFCEECATPLKAAKVTVSHLSSLAEITAALSEARARQTVTASCG
jgi:predicted amidophosphoribosyltransferase